MAALPIHLLGWLFTTLAFAGAVYAAMAARFVGKFAARPTRSANSLPPVTVFKPLHGDEPALEENLESFFAQNYPAPYQIVLGVHDAGDGAVPVAEKLRARHDSVPAILVADGRRQGTNPKVANLLNMESSARHEVWVLSDSDIGVQPDYLKRIAAALEPDRVGAVTCLYTGWAAAGFASRLSAMGVSYQFLPNVVMGLGLDLAKPCFGSTIAIKLPLLRQIGGLKAFASQLADDHAIGAAVRAKGYEVAIPPFTVRHACGERNLREWFAHELRWMRTIRSVDPAGHAGSIVTHAFPLALLGLILAGPGPLTLFAIGASLLARLALKWQIDASFEGSAGPYWLLPVRDVLSFAIFLTSLVGASVRWRDTQLRVQSDGALSNR